MLFFYPDIYYERFYNLVMKLERRRAYQFLNSHACINHAEKLQYHFLYIEKGNNMKKLMLSLLAAQSLLATVIRTESDRAQDRGCCNKICVEPKGTVYRGYGPNLTPGGNIFVKCNMFNNKGCQVGYVTSSSTSNPNTAEHTFVLNKGGKLDVVFTRNSDILSVIPVDADAVMAFPEAAPYLDNPDAVIWLLDGNHSINDAGTVSWQATGSLKKVNYVEVRCVYLVLNGTIIQCLGCHWTLARKQ